MHTYTQDHNFFWPRLTTASMQYLHISECFFIYEYVFISEKALREMQTLRTGCSKAEPKNFAPTQFRVIVVTDPQTHKTNPQTGPITIHCATAS